MQFCLVQRIVKIQHSLRIKKITKHIDAFKSSFNGCSQKQNTRCTTTYDGQHACKVLWLWCSYVWIRTQQRYQTETGGRTDGRMDKVKLISFVQSECIKNYSWHYFSANDNKEFSKFVTNSIFWKLNI